jgi:hypothetical protein
MKSKQNLKFKEGDRVRFTYNTHEPHRFTMQSVDGQEGMVLQKMISYRDRYFVEFDNGFAYYCHASALSPAHSVTITQTRKRKYNAG